jgi:hypothetical protein
MIFKTRSENPELHNGALTTPICRYLASIRLCFVRQGFCLRLDFKTTGFSDTWFQRTFMNVSSRYPMKVLHTQWVLNIHIQDCREARACPLALRYTNASSNALASFKSAVSKPSVNQWYTGARRSWASWRFPCWCHRRARLVAARNSRDLAC